jgi:hypothetical protein
MEIRSSDVIWGLVDEEIWRAAQGIPGTWVGGVRHISCTKCSNLFEVWIREQPIWKEFMADKVKATRLEAELKAGKRDPGEVERELLEHEAVTVEAWMKKAHPIVTKWWADRKAVIGKENDVRKAELKAAQEARDAARAAKGSHKKGEE